MKIIVGLGNIGKEYEKTRHNCGFMVLDEFAKKLEKEGTEVSWKEEKKLKAILAKFNYGKEKVLLVKPTTLMNLSGECIREILNFYKEALENLIVIYDDIDLPLGTIRIREKGSAGTHNGMRSTIQALSSEDFKRIRLGIESRGETSPKQQELHDFVLSNFKKEELTILKKAEEEVISELKKIFA